MGAHYRTTVRAARQRGKAARQGSALQHPVTPGALLLRRMHCARQAAFQDAN
jgi:hypothetical protein